MAKKVKTFWGEAYVYALRVAAMAIVASISWITISYSADIYYDRSEVLRDAFSCVSKTMASHEAPHWLVNGSLLGAVRLKHFVMWDPEINVAMVLDRISAAVPVMARVSELCDLTMQRLKGSGEEASASDGAEETATEEEGPGSWRLCSSRVCVLVHEYLRAGERLLSPFGAQPKDTALPTADCTIAGIRTQCPNDDDYFLSGAFGSHWRTARLTQLFS